jgi:hypothetical protein
LTGKPSQLVALRNEIYEQTKSQRVSGLRVTERRAVQTLPARKNGLLNGQLARLFA